MKVLIDTNVILDVLCKRQDFFEDSSRVMKYCEVDKIDGVISALSIPNIIYIMRKELDAEKTKDIIEKLQLIFTVADLKSDDIKKALSLNFNDFEDALQSACASRIKADYIVTRNIRDFKNSRVIAIKPSELLERI
ncbi:MAG: PIN domain-containing protein [Clostridia bacterium]|nr:PIN domain-containing protein [Clostridia bacterium]